MKNKSKYSIIVGVIILLLILTGVTYAFFNYTRVGLANNIKVGNIYFNASQNGNINLTNAFPITSEELDNDVGNHDSVTVAITGNTDYEEGIEYLVTTDQANIKVNGKRVPIYFNTEVTGVGTSSDDYYNERGSTTSVYELNEEGILKNEKYLLVGYIAPGQTGINGSITITVYIDGDRILVSDTYNGTGEGENGTSPELAAGKTVFTTEEWNSLKGDNALSFKIKVEANEGIWVRDPSDETPGKCFTCNVHGVYGYNTNREQSDINDCVSFLSDEGWGADDGETLEAFCAGTGTNWGDTIQEYIENDWFSSSYVNYFLNHNIISNLGYNASITDYDISCGRNVVIPATIDIEKKSYTYNSNMNSDEIEDCVNFFGSELEWSVNTSDGESLEAFCAGTGTCWGSYLSEMISNDEFSHYNINRLEELNIVNSTSETITANVEEIGSHSFENQEIQSVSLPTGLKNISPYAFRGSDIDEVDIPSTVTGNMCRNFVFDIGVQITQNNETFTCGCFSTFDYNDGIGIGLYDNSCPKDVVIPNKIDGKTVMAIGGHAFYQKGITSVTIPDTVTVIGSSAFSANNLTSVDLPDNLTTIEDNAFYLNNITSIEIPENVTEISSYAFSDNKISSISFPSGLRKIGKYAFMSNELETVEIPSTITSVMQYAFYGNPTTRLVLPDNLFIEQNSFSIIDGASYVYVNSQNCTNIRIPLTIGTLVLGDKVENEPYCTNSQFGCSMNTLMINSKFLVERDYVVFGAGTRPFITNKRYVVSNLVIGDNITIIGNYLAYDGQLTSVTISDSVTDIGEDAFSKNNISSLNLGNGVETIGSAAFYSNSLTGELIIPNSVKTINSSAFVDNGITSVVIPDSVETIGGSAFNLNDLVTVTIGNGINSIGAIAFNKTSDNNNTNLSSITIDKPCSTIKSMTNYAWIGTTFKTGTTIYGSNNEVCDAY